MKIVQSPSARVGQSRFTGLKPDACLERPEVGDDRIAGVDGWTGTGSLKSSEDRLAQAAALQRSAARLQQSAAGYRRDGSRCLAASGVGMALGAGLALGGHPWLALSCAGVAALPVVQGWSHFQLSGSMLRLADAQLQQAAALSAAE